MTTTFPFLRIVPAALALACSAVFAVDNARLKDIEARYQNERTACENAQDKAACLHEAAAARAEARRGTLEGTSSAYEQNALARCAALPADERDSCARRVRGEGEVRGSVSEGDIIREYREMTLPSSPAQ